MTKRTGLTLVVTVLALAGLTSTILLSGADADGDRSVSQSLGTNGTAAPTQPPLREMRDGFDIIAEDTLIVWARNFLGIGPDPLPHQQAQRQSVTIEMEQGYFIKAGYYRLTASMFSYRSLDPNYPLFVYTVRGQLGAPAVSFGNPGSGRQPAPTRAPMQAAYVIIDAVTGSLVGFGNNSFLDQTEALANYLTEAERQSMMGSIVLQEATLNADGNAVVSPEATADVLPLPSPEYTAEPGFRQP